MNATKNAIALAVALVSASPLRATTWYADAVGGNDANDGSTPAKAVRTLVAAMALPDLADGDTVIALPGTYDALTATGADGAAARVVIGKAITLRSVCGRATRDITVIKGSTNSVPVRCVTLAPGADKTATLEGFTLLEGGTTTTGSDVSSNRGGGALVASGTGYVVDCLIKDCQARTGGGMAMASSGADGGAVRCHFRSCTATTAGLGLNNVPAYWCVFTDFPAASIQVIYHAQSKSRPCINCTFYANASCAGVVGPLLNTLIIQSNSLSANIYATNCVSSVKLGANFTDSTGSVSSPTFMMAPSADDFRAIAGQTGVNYGNATFLNLIPEGYRTKDFNGDTVVATDGKVTVGACTVPVTPVGGSLQFDDANYAVNGRRIAFGWTRIRADSEDAVFDVSPDYGDGIGVWSSTDRRGTAWASRSGRASIAPPASGTLKITDCVQTSRVITVGAGRAYTTIQAAVDAAEANTVIRVEPGVYATGGATGLGLSNRVFVGSGKNVQLISTDGPETTIVEGVAASTPVVGELSKEEFGLGSDAVRCLAVESDQTVRIDGFTFRNGHTDYDGQERPANELSSRGGGIYCANESVLVRNCIVTNCYGVRAGGVGNGTYVNCRIVGNVAVYTGSAATQNANSGSNGMKLNLHGCLIDGNWGCSSVLYYYNAVNACTFGTGNHGATSAKDGAVFGGASVNSLCNSLFLRKHDTTQAALTPTNCAYVTNFLWKAGSTFTSCVSAGEFNVDDGYVPVGAADNVLLGAADASQWNVALCGDRDLSGRPRLRGNAMDIGCFQADMAPAFAVALEAKGRVTVGAAKARATAFADRVNLFSGTLTVSQPRTRMLMLPVSITGKGALVVRNPDGVAVGLFTSAGGMLALEGNTVYGFTYYPAPADSTSVGAVLARGALDSSGLVVVIQ